jgi:hypothetical protein
MTRGAIANRLGKLEESIDAGKPDLVFIRLGQAGPSPVLRTIEGQATLYLTEISETIRQEIPDLSHFDLTRDRATGQVMLSSLFHPGEPPEIDPWAAEMVDAIFECAEPEQRILMNHAMQHGYGWRVMSIYH